MTDQLTRNHPEIPHIIVEKPDGWYFKKEVSLAHIITTVTLIVAGFWWASDIKTSIIALQQSDNFINERIESYKVQNLAQMIDIKTSLIRIEDKLDRKEDKK